MMTAATAEALRRIRDDCARKAELIEAEIRELQADREACERLLARYWSDEPNARHAHISPSHLLGCRSQMDAFRVIARFSRGEVRVSEAGRLVHAAGFSKGKASSVITDMYNRLKRSDEWELAAPGTFRLLERTER